MLSRPRNTSKHPPVHVIIGAGIQVVGQRLRAYNNPGSIVRFLVHLAIGCYFFVHYVAGFRMTAGPSMLPTLNVSGDAAVVCWLYAHGQGVKTGDLISYQHPILRGQYAIKRVIALEGDIVLRDTPGGLNGELSDVEGWAHEKDDKQKKEDDAKDQAMVKVPKGHCWVVGDNLSWSRDSRIYGPVPLALVRGKVVAIKKPGWPWQGWRAI